MFDIENVRADFPILDREIYGRKLIYLDNAATTQKPSRVIAKIKEVYELYNSNIHRSISKLAATCTDEYENARKIVCGFINAKSTHEIVFTSGTTAAINLLAFSFGEKFVNKGDEIVVCESEHHSNIVPWQLMCERKNAVLKVLPFDDKGDLKTELLDELMTERTRLLCVAQATNVLGTVNPLDEIVRKAHEKGVYVLVDGAQGIQHVKTDVIASDFDFYVFSGHKIYAPTGTGILYGKEQLLEQLPPWQGGGDMVKNVSFDKTTYSDLPLKFEAGTSNYVGAIGLGEALNYLTYMGIEKIHLYEKNLTDYALEKISSIPEITIYGKSANKIGVASFLAEGIHHADMGEILDKMGIAVRTGRMCADPTVHHFGLTGLVRASWTFYNTKPEIDSLCEGIEKAKKIFKTKSGA
ncbi:MAG: SufS family cysteine desulfurase [Prevotellaceae bacterium]|jgi:cysteine desulfurase/selenocysteine lyase|nr:SufS family cysteine desulfurase [Prevotellaceae bacterium]